MHGLVILDKPAGVTSHRALAPVKAAVPRGVRVGHAGTLDPFATGVLLVLIGDATRLFDAVGTLEKEYEANVLFGEETETLDPEGKVVRKADPGPTTPDGLADALAALTGEVDQIPPAFSALKVGGRRASDRARAGEIPELSPRRVTIHEMAIMEHEWPRVRIRVRCGSGTYVRAIARDLGTAIGLPARLDALRRTAIGPFLAADGLAPDAAAGRTEIRAALVPSFRVVTKTDVPRVSLKAGEAGDFGHGRPLPVDRPDADFVAVVLDDPELLLGLGRVEAGVLRPSRVFADGRTLAD